MDGLLAFAGILCSALLLVAPIASLALGWNARTRLRIVERELLDLRLGIERERRQREESDASAHRAQAGTPPVMVQAAAPEQAATPVPVAEASAPATPPPATVPPSPATPAAPPPPRALPAPPPAATPPASAHGARPAPAPPELGRLAIWALAALAGLAFVVGAFFFYDYSVERGWITAGVRYALGLGVGVGLMVGAEALWKRAYTIPAAALSGAGVGVLYAALYAGYTRLDLVGNSVTFAGMVGVTAVASLVAVRHRSQFLAILGAIGGFGTPVMLSTGQNRAVALFCYLGLLNAGLLMAALRRGWPAVVALAGLATLSIQIGWGIQFRAADQIPVGLVAPVLLGALFAAGALRGGEDRTTPAVSGFMSLGTLLAALPFLLPMRETWGVLGEGHSFAAWVEGLWLVGVSAACSALGTRRGWPALVGLAMAAAVLPLGVYAGSWAGAEVNALAPVGLAVVGVAALPWWISARRESAAIAAGWLIVGALGAGVVILAVAAGDDLDSRWGALVAMGGALAALSLVSAARGPGRWTPLVGLAVMASLALVLQDPLVEQGRGGILLSLGAGVVLGFGAFPFLPELLPREEGRPPLAPTLASVLAGPALFLPMYAGWKGAFGTGAIGLLPVLLGVLALVGVAALARGRSAGDRDLALYTAIALLFLAVAIPIQLSREWLTLGWALEVAALAWVRGRLTHPLLTPTALVLAAFVAARLLLNPDALDYHLADGPFLFNWIAYTWGVPALCFLYAAGRLSDAPEIFAPVLRVTAILLLFVGVNLEVSHTFSTDGALRFLSDDFTEEMTRSITWAAFGLAVGVAGVITRGKVTRVVAFLFLFLAAAKVGFSDVWNLGGLARVGSIFGIGIFLTVAIILFSWLEKRLADEAAESGAGEGR